MACGGSSSGQVGTAPSLGQPKRISWSSQFWGAALYLEREPGAGSETMRDRSSSVALGTRPAA